jgi:hypothetical protein
LLALAAVVAAAAGALAVGLATRGGGSPKPATKARPPAARPIVHSPDAQQQARNIAIWLRANAR